MNLPEFGVEAWLNKWEKSNWFRWYKGGGFFCST